MHIKTIRMDCRLYILRGRTSAFPNNDVSLSLMIVFTLTISVDPDERPICCISSGVSLFVIVPVERFPVYKK